MNPGEAMERIASRSAHPEAGFYFTNRKNRDTAPVVSGS